MASYNFDPILITTLQQIIGITPDEAQLPSVLNKLQFIAGFFGGMPLDQIEKKIREISMGKMIEDKLSHVWSFCELNNAKNLKVSELEFAKESHKENLLKEIQSLSEDIDMYYN